MRWNPELESTVASALAADLETLEKCENEIVAEKRVTALSAYLRDTGTWPSAMPLAAANGASRSLTEHSGDSLFGHTQCPVSVAGKDLTIFDPGIYFEFVNENAWHEGEEVSLSRKDRLFLVDCLDSGTPQRDHLKVLDSTHREDHGVYTVEDGEIAPDGNEPQEESTPIDHDKGYENQATRPLTEAQKKVVRDIHVNCGHPSKEEFLRALRLSRARSTVLDYVRQGFKCKACKAEGKMVKPSPAAVLPRTFRFNKTLGMDLFELRSYDGDSWIACNMLCWGTLFQLVDPVADKCASTVAQCVLDRWIRYFGPPLVVIVDQGKEFVGKDFTDMCNAQGILLHVIDVRAPWQNGRTERHGDLFKKLYDKTCWMQTPNSKETERKIIAECNSCRNRQYNRSGYSPLQRVLVSVIACRQISPVTTSTSQMPSTTWQLLTPALRNLGRSEKQP